MMKFRVSILEDLAQLKQLWKLAFHDEDLYIDNFFSSYGSVDKVFVVEEEREGEKNIVGMTVWFGSVLHRGGKEYPFGYLYAVATHPDKQGQGIAGELLSYVNKQLEKEGFSGVTTVPATSSLHRFFGKQGFREYFEQNVGKVFVSSPLLSVPSDESKGVEGIEAEEYGILRERLLSQLPSFGKKEGELSFVSLEEGGFAYQKSVCLLGQGDLCYYGPKALRLACLKEETWVEYVKEHKEWAEEMALFVVEAYAPQEFMLKEWLGTGRGLAESKEEMLEYLRGLGSTLGKISVRGVFVDCEEVVEERTTEKFGMIQWFGEEPMDWDWGEVGYLGCGFD